MFYRKEIDGLRALSIIPVILYHSDTSMFSGGYIGVDVFFVISGYLITTLILQDIQNGTFSLSNFYERRARRILPALMVVMLFAWPFAWLFFMPVEMERFAETTIATILFISNILFWHQSGDYFALAAELNPLIHTWSLAIEEQYYLLFPIVLLIINKYLKLKIYLVLGLLFLGSLFWGVLSSQQYPIFSFYMLPTRLWELLAGSIVAVHIDGSISKTHNKRKSEFLSFIGLVLIISSSILFNNETPFPSIYATAPVLGAVLIIMFCSPGTVTHKILTFKPLVGVGLVSYSAYLWHQPIFAFIKHQTQSSPHWWVLSIACLLTMSFAYLSWKYVEQPFRNREIITKKKLLVSMSGLGSLFLCLGLMADHNEGNLHRYTEDELEIVGDHLERNAYVWRRNNALQFKPFSTDKRTVKILVLGDSFSADLINAFHESSLLSRKELSSVAISRSVAISSGSCFEQFARNLINSSVKKHCGNAIWWQRREELEDLIHRSSYVLLAHDWQENQLSGLRKEIDYLNQRFGEKFFIVGTKQWNLDFNELPRVLSRARKTYLVAPSEHALSINKKLGTLFPSSFIDILDLMCPSRKCPAFTPKSKLISYDSTHLTQAGAGYLGSLLEKQRSLEVVFENLNKK